MLSTTWIAHWARRKLKNYKEAQVLRAEGEVGAVLTVAKAAAEAPVTIGASLQREGGMEAMKMRMAEDFIERRGGIAKKSNVMIVPADMGDLSKVVGTAFKRSSMGSRRPRPKSR